MGIRTNDIYFKMDTRIVSNGFWSYDINGKKQQIEAELINFTREKMQEYGFTRNITDGTTTEELTSLLLCVDSHLSTREDKNEFFRHYTHYILKVAGTLQGWEIAWWQEDDESLRENPLIEFNDEGMLDSLKTHNETSPVNATLFVLDIFNNYFAKDNQHRLRKVFPFPFIEE